MTESAQSQPSNKFADRFGRTISYVRISVTDRCNFRCVYCMPAEGIEHVPRPELLTLEEIVDVARVFAKHGVDRFRITGGEPLVRSGITDLVGRLKAIEGISEIAMTTNAFLLARRAAELRDAGLDVLNISLDTLQPERFSRISRMDQLDRVIQGIDAAREAGFEKIKLNAVIIRGFNDDELADLIRFAAERECIMRFIEFMPIGTDTVWGGADRCVSAAEMRHRLIEEWDITPDTTRYGRGPARYWRATGGGLPTEGVPVGIIAAVTECFCDLCNRVRITPQGGLRACLADDGEIDLRAILRDPTHEGLERDSALERAIKKSLFGKEERHAFDIDGDSVTRRRMHAIGG